MIRYGIVRNDNQKASGLGVMEVIGVNGSNQAGMKGQSNLSMKRAEIERIEIKKDRNR